MKGRKILTAALAAAMALTMGACDLGKGTGGGTVERPLASAQDVYGMGAVTTVSLLGSTFTAQSVERLTTVARLDSRRAVENDETTQGTPNEPAAGENEPATGGDDAAKEQLETFNKYFNMLDGMLGEGVVSTETTENTDADYAEFARKMTIRSFDLAGNAVEHVMYYNETAAGDGDQAGGNGSDADDADDDDDDKTDGESEAAFTLDGVLVADGTDYRLSGERTEEAEGGETEAEIAIRAYPDETDASTYVEVKQETEAEAGETETEYVYSVFEAGVLIEKTKVEFETEAKETKTETGVSVEFVSGGAKGRYEIEKTVKSGKTEIEVKYAIDGESGKFEIVEKRGQNGEVKYEYRFSDGETAEMDRDDD